MLGVGLLFDFIHNPLINALYAVGKHQRLAVANVVEAGLNVVLSIVLSYRYGVTGVAIGTTLPLILIRRTILGPWGSRMIGLTTAQFDHSPPLRGSQFERGCRGCSGFTDRGSGGGTVTC